ncbi:hypothetical protein EUTSA_v10016475mg [Eutrema salsugineum]|uniref:Uncharacterized protein n=1 Tax=Eutrema salsugineum TaxID=72664 RepID=V4MA99_EUTSA|nr:uncharacterized protein LOC18026990 [Eutrema salsugineum]ESQ52012.1 hypothetical protein EUTSA_v10016475mg [Eutrema salsugineum]
MSERKLNFDAPLLSTRQMKKTAMSVRRNMAKKLTDDDESKTSESPSVPVLVQDTDLNRVPESASVPFTCPVEKAIDGNLTRRLHSSKGKQVEEESDDDVFSDALDTLSLKHSINGNVEATKTPMPSSEDPQSRDFMLNRFLPAAKSMTVEQQPPYALKRQAMPVMYEPIRQIRDILPAENRATPKRYEYNTTPSYYQDIDYEESDEDEDDDEASEYLSRRGCGMSPQLCFKNSLGMLSSVHGLKEKPYSLRTSSHDQVKSSKVAQLKSRFQSVKKLALDSIYKQKVGSRVQSPIHPSVGKKFNFGSEQLESNLTTASMPSSPYRQIGCMSPYRSVGNCSPLHPGTRKEAEIMRANRLNKHIRNNSKPQDLLYPKSTRLDWSTSSIMEKTLYVDTENCPKTSNDEGNSNVKILPETMEIISEEPEMAGKKPKAVLELQALETLSISSGIKKMKAEELEKNNSGCDLSPLALPTPKKPSDSWLFRNLPLVSSKIPSRRYLFHPQKKDLEENSTSVTKWETIVKTSCMQRDHIRYSEELVSRSSCQSTT